MGINLDKMRAKLATLKGQGGDRDNFWRPEDGTQAIRIVPTPDGDPFKEKWFHYNLGNTPGFLCPKRNYNDECSVCEFASKLWRDGVDKNDDESKKLAKSFFVRPRFFSPVLVRGEEDKGVRIWGYGKTIYETLLGLVLNPDYGDITDVDNGVDFTLTYTLPKTKGAFPQTNLTPKRKSSALAKNKGTIKEMLESVPEIATLFPRKSPSDVKAILESFLNPSDGPLNDDVGISSVDDAIRELSA